MNTTGARAFFLTVLFAMLLGRPGLLHGQKNPASNPLGAGYRGIWFTLNQFSAYGDKYSGGLGTYTAHHIPMGIHAPEVNKTFFVYGGTRTARDRHLLCMIGSFDHHTGKVSRPVVVHDKGGVDDPHDNPSILIDPDGFIWVFVSGRSTSRMGYKYKSVLPYDHTTFELVSEEVMTYPQPWYIPGEGYFHFFTKYTGVRELYFETSRDGVKWTEDRKLAGIKNPSYNRSGHYQVSNHAGSRIVTFFNWHPDGNVDKRTNVYFVQTRDFGKTFETIDGKEVSLPLVDIASPARVVDLESARTNVYLCDVAFDAAGHPVCLYVTSGGHEPGPGNGPREWHVLQWNGRQWTDRVVCSSDHNYDMGSLFIEGDTWMLIAPTGAGPQPPGAGGEIEVWESRNAGVSWKRSKRLTTNSPRNHNYVRRVVNGKSPFLYFWADGDPNGFSRSYLYSGDGEGRVWQLPYDMDTDAAPLKKLK